MDYCLYFSFTVIMIISLNSMIIIIDAIGSIIDILIPSIEYIVYRIEPFYIIYRI